jgi:hypothetical protein
MQVQDSKLVRRYSQQMDREVTCLDINSFKPKREDEAMDDVSAANEKAPSGSRRCIEHHCVPLVFGMISRLDSCPLTVLSLSKCCKFISARRTTNRRLPTAALKVNDETETT